MATTKKTEEILIKPVETRVQVVRIVGDSPLIVHAWSEKAKRLLIGPTVDEKDPLPKKKKEPRDPWYDFINAAYWIEGKPEENTQEAFYKAVNNGARFGFPATGIKQAAVNGAARGGAALKQAVGRGTFFIKGEGLEQLVEIKGCVPEKREDIVRLANKTTVAADVRWRPMFTNWYMDLEVAYNINGLLSLEQIINMINLGGFVCGIGEWRPEKDGMYGMFHVNV